MSWAKTDKEKERYYLFAGMGGEPTRRKNRVFLKWAIVAGVAVSAVVAVVLLLVNGTRLW